MVIIEKHDWLFPWLQFFSCMFVALICFKNVSFLCVFQNNTHQLTLSMSPDERFLEKQAEAEEQKLQQKIQILSDADRKDIYEKGTLARPGRTRIISLLLLQRLNHVVVFRFAAVSCSEHNSRRFLSTCIKGVRHWAHHSLHICTAGERR